ncbi:MAG: carboxypeptidase regulatory-like domain-containing protein [Planctomycetes bacterium]|nr:carboxypeptidase regulatory-like domain-containing protein [Planctomycetota bacterium]MBI3848073.1 carboxypeptidase regulatory-like domain-containing protein [Planctomycetota bacterium]
MRTESFDSEDEALRAALAPVCEVPGGLDARIGARLRAHRRRRIVAFVVPAALAAGAVAAALLLRSPTPASAPATALRFDPVTRRLSLPDGTSLLLGEGADAEFREVEGTRGLVRLREGDVYCDAASGSRDLVVEAPGLRARTRGGRFVATTKQQEGESMNGAAVTAGALLYVFSGQVDVDEGAKPNDRSPYVNVPVALSESPKASIERHGRSLFLDGVPLLAGVFRESESADARLHGLVVGVDGRPIANAEVEIRGNDSTLATVRADATGSFAAMGLVDGNVTLVARANGCLEATIPATLASKNDVEIPTITLREERHVRGRVVDRFGAPVAGAEIKVERVPEPSSANAEVIDLALNSTTAIESVPYLRVRQTLASVLAPRFEPVRLSLDAKVDLTIDGATPVLSDVPVLSRAVTFQGLNRLFVTSGLSWTGVTAGDDGRFDVGGLEEGEVTVSASLPEWVDVSGPLKANAGAEDVTLVLARGGEIRGTVYGPDGAPLSGARVNDVVTDSDGRYRIAGLSAGTVDLFAGPAELRQVVLGSVNRWKGKIEAEGDVHLVQSVIEFNGESRGSVRLRANTVRFLGTNGSRQVPPGLAARRGIFVSEGELQDGVDFHLPAARTIEGTVVDDLGLPIAGATVTFRADESIPHFESSRTATTDESGTFRLIDVFDVPGTVGATADDHLGCDPADVVPALRLELPRAACVHGQLGVPGSLMLLNLASVDGGAQHFDVAPESDESPEFRIPGLSPGRYEITFIVDEETHVSLGTVLLRPGETTELGRIR